MLSRGLLRHKWSSKVIAMCPRFPFSRPCTAQSDPNDQQTARDFNLAHLLALSVHSNNWGSGAALTTPHAWRNNIGKGLFGITRF